MQTDKTTDLSDSAFDQLEDEKLQEAALMAKPKGYLSADNNLMFNEGISANLKLHSTYRQQLSTNSLAPTTSLTSPNSWSGRRNRSIVALKRPIFIFVNGSFANNVDLSLKIGLITLLANKRRLTTIATPSSLMGILSISALLSPTSHSNHAGLQGIQDGCWGRHSSCYLLHYKGNTMKAGNSFNPNRHVYRLIPPIQGKWVVKLGTTVKKCLTIDIMALRQSHKRRDLTEVRLIDRSYNLSDAMKKSNPNAALERPISENNVTV
ncbi:hypothetical protein CH63R_01773 [Colletotrichum higginsianum IMI 349063]|uniref:Uncharacterized protein n=1 Tax=Colletotrichum higginsianum (strain IMI 349063) TaxID=759273 RepID=A0A1B7YX11_COLHI|nr:hypothetical protein CH63R_01773 [Colletotrichum higginsianum IMI 349063]OBR16593.1 hypothetical protein CH63R_01773 [Colletotrichum higginsianum IMI 349063]